MERLIPSADKLIRGFDILQAKTLNWMTWR